MARKVSETENENLFSDGIDPVELAAKTGGFSGADIRRALDDACSENFLDFLGKSEIPPPVGTLVLERVIRRIRESKKVSLA